MPVLRSRY